MGVNEMGDRRRELSKLTGGKQWDPTWWLCPLFLRVYGFEDEADSVWVRRRNGACCLRRGSREVEVLMRCSHAVLVLFPRNVMFMVR